MKFLCLGYLNADDFDSIPEAERETIMSQCPAHCVNMRASKQILAEAGLEQKHKAKSIRPRNGRPWVTDGPFIETKEQLGSFFIVEAKDIDEAVEIASKHPAALLGEEYGFGIEVRPLQHQDIFTNI